MVFHQSFPFTITVSFLSRTLHFFVTYHMEEGVFVMLVEFVGRSYLSLLGGFFLQVLRFPLTSKTNTSKSNSIWYICDPCKPCRRAKSLTHYKVIYLFCKPITLKRFVSNHNLCFASCRKYSESFGKRSVNVKKSS